MPKVYSKMRLNSDGHGSLVCKISGPKATTLPAWWNAMFQMSLPVHTCEGPINFKAAEIRCTIEIRCTFEGLSLEPLMMRWWTKLLCIQWISHSSDFQIGLNEFVYLLLLEDFANFLLLSIDEGQVEFWSKTTKLLCWKALFIASATYFDTKTFDAINEWTVLHGAAIGQCS